MPDPRLAEIGEAIEALAERAKATPGSDGDVAEFSGCLADIWAMVAELDPGVAASLAGYAPDSE